MRARARASPMRLINNLDRPVLSRNKVTLGEPEVEW